MKSSAKVLGVAALVAAAGLAQGQNCTFVTGPDVIVGDITGPSNFAAAGGIDAFSLGTTSCNLGNVQLRWDQFPANTHPAIGGAMYRLSTVNNATRFEQVGMSWLKHGFTALQNTTCCTNCSPSGTGTRLGIGCSDPYTSARNGSQSGLGPRYQINAHTGAYPTGGVATGTGGSGNTFRRLEVLVSDLVATTGGTAATTRFFGESQYISPDDAAAGNQNNNASFRELNISGTTDFSASFTSAATGFIGTTQRQLSAIRAWKVIDPTVTETLVQVPNDGLYVVCSKATALPGGTTWHYEYAIYNMNGDRNVGSVGIPIADSLPATNQGTHYPIYRNGDGIPNPGAMNFSSTDWTRTKSGGVLTFATETQATNINANCIRWSSTYNFRFDTTIAPRNGTITLGLWKPPTGGDPVSVTAAAVIPGTVIVTPCHGACVADFDDGTFTGTPDGGVTIDDLLYYLFIFDQGLICADVDDGTFTGTQDNGVTIDDLLYYLFRFDSGC